MRNARRDRANRNVYIAVDPEILGRTPVIRSTRLSVQAVLGRLDGGDAIDELLADYPHISRAAFEAAATYARTHPLTGRPGGRP